MSAGERLLIVGASVRAAVQSAQRAGWAAHAVDLFADVDLQQAATSVTRCEDYPRQLPELAASAPGMPWMYTGALENHPGIVDAISAERPLWGNRGDVLRAVRDPEVLCRGLRAAGFCVPDWSACEPAADEASAWLSKPLRSAGGTGIVRCDHRLVGAEVFSRRATASATMPERFYQRVVHGTPCAAIYVACAGEARLVGVTRQGVGLDWTGANGYRYCGTIGPLRLPPIVAAEFNRLGRYLAREFELRGLFGVDAILSPAEADASGEVFDDGDFRDEAFESDAPIAADSRVWPIEVNPRYTASVEVLERALEWPALEWHVRACRDRQLPSEVELAGLRARQRAACGKAILFAEADVVISERWMARRLAENSGQAWPLWADLPAGGSKIERGWPIATAFSEGGDGRKLRRMLEDARRELRRTPA